MLAIYRLTLYKPRSLNDAAESQVLVPVGAGAAIHSQEFRVASAIGITIPGGTNSILQSRTFDNASWSATNCAVLANQTNAPDGTLTADAIRGGNLTGLQTVTQAAHGSNTTQQTFKVCIKKAVNASWCILRYTNNAGTIVDTWFDLVNGVFGNLGANITATNWGLTVNSFYELEITCSTSNTGAGGSFSILPSNGNGNTAFTGDGSTLSLYVWEAYWNKDAGQIGKGLFITTTTAPVTRATATFQPYMDTIRGRHGRVDFLKKQTDVGQLTVKLLDNRVTAGGTNANRWFTAFTGDAQQHDNLIGCKGYIEESTDQGVTWNPFFTGRLTGYTQDSRVSVSVTLSDLVSDMDFDIFTGFPHSSITYASKSYAWPIGTPVAYGPYAADPSVRLGTKRSSFTYQGANAIDITNADGWSNVVMQNLANFLDLERATTAFGLFASFVPPLSSEVLRLHITQVSGGASGELQVYGLGMRRAAGDYPYRIDTIYVKALPNTDPYFIAMPADGAALKNLWLKSSVPTTDKEPFIIGDVHPVQLWKDILDGDFSWLDSTGAQRRSIAYDATQFAALIADTSFGKLRGFVKEPAKAHQWIEENICVPFGLAYRITAAGAVYPIDMRRKNAVTTTASLVDADLDAKTAPKRSIAKGDTYTRAQATFYADSKMLRDGAVATFYMPGNPFPDAPCTLFTDPVDRIVQILDFGSRAIDYGDRMLDVKIPTIRSILGRVENGTSSDAYAARRITDLLTDLRTPYASGMVVLDVVCRRTANVSAVNTGDFINADFSSIINAATDVRGGSRLYRVLERSEDGVNVKLKLMDAGTGIALSTPTLAAPAGNSDGVSIDVTVTLDGSSDPVEVWGVATDTSVAVRPVDADPGWQQLRPSNQLAQLIYATGSYNFAKQPQGKRVWMRARSVPGNANFFRLVSAWVYPSTGTGYVDMATITAPSALSVTNIQAVNADMSWTNGSTTAPVKVYLVTGTAPGSWTDLDLYATLQPGTHTYTLRGLDPSTQFTVGIRHEDGYGSYSTMATATFTTTATGVTLTTPKGITPMV